MTDSGRAPRTIDLSARLVLMSGAAGSLGQAIGQAVSNCGATVVGLDVKLTEDINRLAGLYEADTTSASDVLRVFDEVQQNYGRLPDVVCCHAGIVDSYPAQAYPLESFERLFDVNVRGAWILAGEAVRRWIATGDPGLLLFTSSWVQDVPWPGISAYNASKAALRQLARSFARELAPHGIRANVVAPGIVDAGMARRQWDSDTEYRTRAERAIPLGRLQPLDSVADTFIYAISDMAAYMTGATLLVDGGCSLYPMD